ncbi:MULTISPECIES: hypothetical protein [unclassified Hyphomicrobium]|uniref:hypothetical protein n=1 Tax=unclassified Hyphomicrobium TaxID=2619925 RepID=UPI0012DD5E1D|nr:MULTISPECIES: hypothetical protein [unclassified Hyphomicrobium]
MVQTSCTVSTHALPKAPWYAGSWAAGLSVFLATVGLILAATCPAEAHHPRKSTDKTSGISIPNLTHGQLHVLTRYQSAIMSLANRQVRPSLEARTLQNFVNLQLAYCLWGLVPGSISDEASPFNECSHAYLAATKLLLERLQRADDTRAKADALADQINLAMLEDATALEICSNSFEPFNTAQIIMPMWADMTFNPLGILLGCFIFGASAGGLAMARGGRRSAPSAQ